MADREIRLKLTIDGKDVNATLRLTDEELKQLRKSSRSLSDEMSKWGMIAMGYNQALEMTQKVFNIIGKPLGDAGQFEQYETSLKVMLGSAEKAKARLEELVEFAASTPFELPQVIQAANQLQALGKYSQDNLRMLGDLSSASGKPMEQALSAYAKMVTGQKGIAIDMFRDLLITADDWTKATGKKIGKSGELQASVEEMAKALPKIIKEKGFAGMMDEQSKTLLGMKSNISDALGQLSTELGDKVLPLAKELAGNIIGIIGSVKDNVGTIIPVVETLAIVIVSVTAAIYGARIALILKNTALLLSRDSFLVARYGALLFNEALMANPIGAITAALVILIGTIGVVSNLMRESAADRLNEVKSQDNFIKAQKKTTEEKLKEKQATLGLMKEYEQLSSKTNLTAKEKEKLNSTLIKLNQKYPGLIKSGSDFKDNLKNIQEQSGKTKKEIDDLGTALDRLSEKEKQAAKNILSAQVNVAKEELETQMADAQSNILNKASETIFGSSGVRDNAEKFANSFSNAMYAAKDSGQVTDALLEFQNKVASSDDWGEKAKSAAYLYAQKFAVSRKKYLEAAAGAITEEPVTQDKPANNTIDNTFQNSLQKERNEILKQNQFKIETEKYLNAEYRDLAEERLSKENEISEINKKISKAKNDKELDSLKIKRDLAEQSIKILDNEMERQEELYGKDADLKRKQIEDQIKFEQEQKENEKKLAEEMADMKTAAMAEGHNKQLAELDNWLAKEREKYKGNKDALALIDQQYLNKKTELEKQNSEYQRQMAATTAGQLAGIFGEQTAMFKAGSIYQAELTSYKTWIDAYNWGTSFGGPILGALMAAIAFAATQAQVLKMQEIETPKFARGGLIRVNEEGQEYITNAQSTKKNLGLLEAINNNPQTDFRRAMVDSILNVRAAYSNTFPVNDNGKMFEKLFDKQFEKMDKWQRELEFKFKIAGEDLVTSTNKYNDRKTKYEY